MKFAILIVSPPGYIHSAAFNEVATTLHSGLKNLGHDSIITKIPFPDRYNIILGCNLLPSSNVNLPRHSILYNLEQISLDSSWFSSDLLQFFRNYPLWDYSERNLKALTKMGITNVQHLPVGFTSKTSELPQVDQDIDVLFYGSINQRRKHIIDQLINKGIKVKVINGLYGYPRDQLIARSKIIINIHFYEAKVFEIVRISHLLANSKFVISETGPDSEDQQYFHPGLVFTPYDNLVETCLEYLDRPHDRKLIASQGYQLMRQRPIEQYLTNVINHLQPIPIDGNKKAETSQTLKIDIGCGNKKHHGFIGVDIFPAPSVDVVADLSKKFPFGDNSVDQIIANDFIEHLTDRIHTMNEIWRVCKSNALVDIFVPSSDGRGAFQDPTHVSFWNINSFQYYCIEYPEYLNLCQQYGFQGRFSLVKIDHYKAPGNVIHVRAILRAIKDHNTVSANISVDTVFVKEINLLVCPDWQQSHEQIFNELKEALIILAKHEEKKHINLIIEAGCFNNEEASIEDFLSYLAMDLSLSEGIDISESGLEISVLNGLDETTWKLLSSNITGRLVVSTENSKLINRLGITHLRSYICNDIQDRSFHSTAQLPSSKFWLINQVKDSRIKIGEYSYSDGPVNFVLVNSEDYISIGRFCSIASGVTIFGGGEHFLERVTTFPLQVLFTQVNPNQGNVDATTKGKTIIGNDVWIGQGATILSGVKIGNGVVIGTKAVVAKDIPDYAVVVGNPGQIIRYRFSRDTIAHLLEQKWWNWDIAKIRDNIDLLYQNPEINSSRSE